MTTKPTGEPSDLARRIAVALHCYFYPSLTNERDCVATTISESGLADLEAKLAAKWISDDCCEVCGCPMTYAGESGAGVEQYKCQVCEADDKLAATEDERDEARGRLKEIAEFLSADIVPGIAGNVKMKIRRLTTEKGEG